MKFRFHREASEEYFASVAFYEDEQSGLGWKFVQAVEAGIQNVMEQPDRWRTFDGRLRRVLVETFPFHLIYGIRDGEVVFLAVAHCSRMPGYWKGRLNEHL
jgi:toxin ParE1/3/4